MAIIDDIKFAYRRGSMLMRFIFINIAVCVILHLATLVAWMITGDQAAVLQWVELPSDLSLLIRRPWTLVTYMFSHYALLHILFNMLWLYWLGRIFMEYFSPKQLTGVYLLGGWGGALLFLLAYNLMPSLAGNSVFLIGASASVLAVIVATAVYAPDYKIGLLFLGEVAIKWVAIVTVAIYLIGMETGNIGGNIAHIGGALVGAWFALRIKRGRDITRPLNAVLDAVVGIFNGRSFSWPAARRGNKFAAESYLKEALKLDPSLKAYADRDLELSLLK
jgi:membrane associated rhomboid family serine protease